MTGLQHAAIGGHLEVVQFLVRTQEHFQHTDDLSQVPDRVCAHTIVFPLKMSFHFEHALAC